MQDSFVNIATLFKNDLERDLSVLEQIYHDHERLRVLIQELIHPSLNIQTVQGKKILLKPNWVRHNISVTDMLCLCTNENFIIACVKELLTLQPASILIGDAPIQGCKWEKLLSKNFLSEIDKLSISYNIPIFIKDFRRVVFDPSANSLTIEKNPIEDYLIFDLGKESYLEPITHPTKNTFRVTQYDPDRFTESHKPGMHKYCITKELFNADIVISMPKVKTHQKAGITAALKNIVGLNGDKDFLPHHRVGGTKMGGDSYPGKSVLRYWAELCYDQGNRQRGKWQYKFWNRAGSLMWKLSFPSSLHRTGAAWFGNDTTWRMVMDLNQIIKYGTADGKLSKTLQRTMFSLCDGIIGGQSDGPLKPVPLNLGVVCFTNDSVFNDVCLATLMGMDSEKISLLKAARKLSGFRESNLQINGRSIGLNELKEFAVPAIMPPGWEGYKTTVNN